MVLCPLRSNHVQSHRLRSPYYEQISEMLQSSSHKFFRDQLSNPVIKDKNVQTMSHFDNDSSPDVFP